MDMGRKPEIITKNFISSSGDFKEIEVGVIYLGKTRLC